MHGLKVGDRVYVLSGLGDVIFYSDPIGAKTCDVLSVSAKQIKVREEGMVGRIYEYTLKNDTYGVKWHLTAQDALKHARSIVTKKIQKLNEELGRIDHYYAVAERTVRP